ncbi:hypothetical protein PVK06_023956 [Gossypium arboreum]|uniref:Uncharacterized protein n=1 Tax=Gossypium arboreum TaxID=29729 RepID=A0ABR0PCL5_GOSAR|nr:hypothetical protein PVK06_023956 [Gossypium arboreum]
MEFNWQPVLGTSIGFCGAAFGSVGGVGGGGIVVPMLSLIVGFDPKSATAISKCMIMGAAASTDKYLCRSGAGKNVNEMIKKEVEFNMVFSCVFGESAAKGNVFSSICGESAVKGHVFSGVFGESAAKGYVL